MGNRAWLKRSDTSYRMMLRRGDVIHQIPIFNRVRFSGGLCEQKTVSNHVADASRKSRAV